MANPLEYIPTRSLIEGKEIMIASILSAFWIILIIGYGAGYFGLLGGLATPRDAAFLEIVFFLMVLIWPLLMVWLVTYIVRKSFQIQDGARNMAQRLSEMPNTGSKQGVSQPRIKDNRVETLQEKVGELNAHIKQLETALNSVSQIQSAMQTQVKAAGLPEPEVTETEPEVAPSSSVSWQDLIRALDFPRDETDTEGFRALRIAKRDPNAEELLRAAEDVLNQLSQEGIYTDDLRPEIASAREWRLFANGTRGEDVAAVGGIDAPEALERIINRKNNDQIFRDSSLFFLRRFDIMLRTFVDGASDGQIQLLADTRTGRAFMLLARAAGMFD